MTGELWLGLGGFALLFLLIALRVPIGVAMLTVGLGGFATINGWGPLLDYLKSAPFAQVSVYTLAVIPLFLLMGEFATRAGVSRGLFAAASVWLGHRRGGLAMATVGACAAFGAVCGSSLATAGTMARVAWPEMRRQGYGGSLATAALAAGGTLGILIPPSIVLVLYAILTEQNIAKMFVAALIPGVLAVLGYLGAVAVVARLDPEAAPAAPRSGRRERLAAVRAAGPAAGIFALVIGGIYLGWFTPTEGAAVGAFATGALMLAVPARDRGSWIDCLTGTAQTTGMIFLILLGASVFNVFLALTGLPQAAASAAAESGLPPRLVLATMLLSLLLLGCLMDSLSMILLTVPIFFPVVMALDFGLPPEETALWFGVLALVVVEVGLITPPVGLNVFVIAGIASDVPAQDVYKGIVPFLAADGLRILLLLGVPDISLTLVRLLY